LIPSWMRPTARHSWRWTWSGRRWGHASCKGEPGCRGGGRSLRPSWRPLARAEPLPPSWLQLLGQRPAHGTPAHLLVAGVIGIGTWTLAPAVVASARSCRAASALLAPAARTTPPPRHPGSPPGCRRYRYLGT